MRAEHLLRQVTRDFPNVTDTADAGAYDVITAGEWIQGGGHVLDSDMGGPPASFGVIFLGWSVAASLFVYLYDTYQLSILRMGQNIIHSSYCGCLYVT